jgi:hypothetical protein
MPTIFHCTKLRLSTCNGSWVVAIKQNVNFKYQPSEMFVLFVFRKKWPHKSCSPSEDLSEYKISWSYVEWCKFCIHLRSLNVRRFGMAAATVLKIMASRSLSMAWPPTEFHKNLPITSQDDMGWTDRNTHRSH